MVEDVEAPAHFLFLPDAHTAVGHFYYKSITQSLNVPTFSLEHNASQTAKLFSGFNFKNRKNQVYSFSIGK